MQSANYSLQLVYLALQSLLYSGFDILNCCSEPFIKYNHEKFDKHQKFS